MQSKVEQYLGAVEREAVNSGLADFRLARAEFHKLTGEFEETEPWFETRMTMFLDWYLLDRKGPDGLTPNERYIRSHSKTLNAATLHQHQHLNCTLRSTFQILKKVGDELLLEDLIAGGQWKAKWTLPAVGITPDDVFNSRLILVAEELEIGRGAVLHPSDAHEAIFEIVDRAAREHLPVDQTVYYLDKVKLKLDRYSNVKIRHVYKYPTDVVF